MNPAPTFECGGHTYSIGKLDAMTQFHVARRIAPLMSSVLLSLALLRGGAGQDEMLMAATPGLNVLSQMTDEQSEYVIGACMSCVKRAVGDRWAPVTSTGSTRMMFEDLDVMVLLQLTAEVIKTNLGSFLQGLGAPTTSPSS